MLKRNRECLYQDGLEDSDKKHQDFLAILEKEFKNKDIREGQVVTGHVVRLEGDFAVIDVGLKTEGSIPIQEFLQEDPPIQLQEGDTVEVYLDRIEGMTNEAILSREKARRERTWVTLQKAFEKGERVEGEIFSRVRGGFTVNIGGVIAFLPSSQVDMRPMRGGDLQSMMHVPQMFQILKMDKKRGNVVVSRRVILEEERADQKSEVMKNLEEGQVLMGIVKNITDYGVFVDLGGVDGLLHVTDIAWTRVNHPRDVLKLGETVKVQVIKINPQTRRISLGMKQLKEDPWNLIAERYHVGQHIRGRVTNIQDYGAFVELEPGVEGLVHVSEMSWTNRNASPAKIVSTSQEIEVVILKIESKERRISLGYKQCQPNPWQSFSEHHTVGSVIEGRIENITNYCMFVRLDEEIDAMLHFSDLDWTLPGEEAAKAYQKGQIIKTKILSLDPKEERISLGIKQLTDNPNPEKESGDFKRRGSKYDDAGRGDEDTPFNKGQVVTGVITNVQDDGSQGTCIQVSISGHDGWVGFIRKNDLSMFKEEQRLNLFGVGDQVDAVVMSIDKSARKLRLSIKEREISEKKKIEAEYGHSGSGAVLGDILGLALKKNLKGEDGKDKGSDS